MSKYLIFILVQLFLTVTRVYASNNLNPEELGAKAYLEDILVHRYTQALGTMVDHQTFSVGAQIELSEIPKKKVKDETKPASGSDTPDDFLLGTLDPEQLVKQYNLPDEKAAIVSVLSNKRIKNIAILVGLKESLGAPVKAEVEKWLSTRIKSEFGTTAKGNVSFVKNIVDKKIEPAPAPAVPEKQWWDWLNQFQQLASFFMLALAAIFGVLLWRLTSSKNSDAKLADEAEKNSNNNSASGASAPQKNANDSGFANGLGFGKDDVSSAAAENKDKNNDADDETQKEEKLSYEAFESLSKKINLLVPRLTKDFEQIVNAWCQSGSDGKFKLVCFADAVGRDVGRLPIPNEAKAEVAKLFAEMAQTSFQKKAQALEKVYWDLVSVLNLGPEFLTRPFGFLSGVESNVINKVLMGQNPKLKTLVSLFLPEEVRRKFVGPMTEEQKLELLQNAAQLTEIAVDELRTMNTTVLSQMNGNKTENSLPLQLNLEKIVSSLSMREQIVMLSKITGPVLADFQRKNASLAFLNLWPDSSLAILLAKIQADQAVTYLRVCPEMKDRIVLMAPPMLSEIIVDELRFEDKVSDEEKNRILESLLKLVRDLVEQKDIDLNLIFAGRNQGVSSTDEDKNVIPFKSA